MSPWRYFLNFNPYLVQSGVRNCKPSTEPFFHVSTSLFLGFLREKPQPASLCCAVGHLEGVSECNCQATSSTKIQPHYVPEERISKLQCQIKPNPIGTVVCSSARQCLITSCLIISRFCRFFLALFICAIHSRVRKTLQSQIRGLALFFLYVDVWAWLNFLPNRRWSSAVITT